MLFSKTLILSLGVLATLPIFAVGGGGACESRRVREIRKNVRNLQVQVSSVENWIAASE